MADWWSSLSAQSGPAQNQLTLTLAALNSEAPRSSRDSLHCSSGYSTQTTTPSCSEDTIHSHGKTFTVSHSPVSVADRQLRLPVTMVETSGASEDEGDGFTVS